MSFIFWVFVSLSAFADGKDPIDLDAHLTAEKAAMRAAGKKVISNEDKGYLVKIYAEQFFKKASGYYIYRSDVRSLPVLFLATPAFDLRMEQVTIGEKKNMDNIRALSREGGGSLNPKPTFQIFVLASPRGVKEYVHPEDGSLDKTLAFEVMQMCTSSNFKTCQPIK